MRRGKGLRVLDLVVQPLAESFRHRIFDTISHQFHDVPRPVKNRFAVCADFKMGFHPRAQLGLDVFVDIVGDLSPDL